MKEETAREKILNATLQLFLEHGYKNTSYEMLIKKTKLSKGAIYHHFRSKDELLISVVKFLLEKSLESLPVAPPKEISDYAELKNLILQTKTQQIKIFRDLVKGQAFKLNRLLFFVEAMSENKKVVKMLNEIMHSEIFFLKECFFRMKKKSGMLKQKNADVWAEILYMLMQSAEMEVILAGNELTETNFRSAYKRAFTNFEKLIQ